MVLFGSWQMRGFTRLHQNGGRHYLGSDCKHTLTYFLPLHWGQTQTSRSLSAVIGGFASDPKIADRTAASDGEDTKKHVPQTNSSRRGEMVRSTQLLVLWKSVINNGHTTVTRMTSAGSQGEVWILPGSFTLFKRVPPPSHRMRCM